MCDWVKMPGKPPARGADLILTLCCGDTGERYTTGGYMNRSGKWCWLGTEEVISDSVIAWSHFPEPFDE